MNPKRKVVIFLIMCSVIVYGNSLNNSFVFDDEVVVVNRDFIKDFKNLPKLLSTDYFKYSGELTYRPLVTLSYFVDYRIWGDHPFGFHLTNLLIHILNVISVYFLANLILKNRSLSLFSALLFCVHTIQTEAVDCIAFREDMLCSLFFLLAFVFYIESESRASIRFYVFSMSSFILSILSKEMAFTLPIVIVLYDAIAKNGLPHIKKRLRFYTGYLLIAGVSLYLRFFIFSSLAERASRLKLGYPGGSFYTNILNMLRVVAYYMKLLIIPYPLCPMYVFEESTTIFDSRVIGALIVLVSVLVVLFYLSRKSKVFVFAGAWFFITLLPVYNVVPITNFLAERYLYIPSFGFCLFVPSLLLTIGSGKLRKIFVPGIVTLIVLYSLFTVKRNFDWRDNSTLYKNTLIHFPGNYHMRYNLGNEYLESGKIREAIREYTIAIKDNPSYTKAYNNLGYIYANIGYYERAKKCWLKSLYIDPGNRDVIMDLRKLDTQRP